jgi:hypothetical protein
VPLGLFGQSHGRQRLGTVGVELGANDPPALHRIDRCSPHFDLRRALLAATIVAHDRDDTLPGVDQFVTQPSPATAKPARGSIPLAPIVAAATALIGAAIVILTTTSAHGVAAVPSRAALPAPPQILEPHGHVAAVNAHTLGLLLLVMGVIGIATTLVWMLRTRAGSRPGPLVH